MKTREKKPPLTKEPSFSYGGKYSYADYLNWEMDEMVEIIRGKVFKWTASPSRIHQKVARDLTTTINTFLKDKSCVMYPAPFDVRLPAKSKKNEDIFTVVQPDLCVICDKSKLDDAGCIGAPDLIVEILSPSNNRKELYHKYEAYRESGVKEYWLVHPFEQTLLIYTLKNGAYVPSRLYGKGDIVESSVLKDFQLDLEEFFRDLD
ncbi:Uma2 family endonuclease [Litoribacter ruber]|uniref:Uma2 family endonuclease n=1 Tax=Litoribacter ruber TaxID=702568 RepID=UPI001BDA09CD|nr:Uma2 family endonuclease [Litoribacter ruber]MBT0811504.1 Uma2 family endonuclease [Litoribacter ruber]